MVEAVHQNEIAGLRERREQREVGHVAGREDEGGFGAFERRDAGFDAQMKFVRAPDQARRARADPPPLRGSLHGFDEARMIAQAEVIIGSEIDEAWIEGAQRSHEAVAPS